MTPCRLTIVLAVTVAWASLWTAARAQEQPVWEPAKTRVFIVALATFQSSSLHAFTQDERLDDELVLILKNRGVPASHILQMKDDRATTSKIQHEFTQFLSHSREDESLFFLFSSHGGYNPKTDEYSFYTYDGSLPFSWAFETIEQNFRGSMAIVTADCCHSGGIVDVVSKRKSRVSYACLSSTYNHQTAWSGWRFIQCLNRGFGGQAVVDLNGDHQITLEELVNYTTRYMAFAAEGKPSFKTTGRFHSQLRLASATEKKSRVGELLEARSGQGWAKAEILETEARRFKIHFTKDTKPTHDGWVAEKAIRPFQFAVFPAGSMVEAQDSDGGWHSAKVLQRWESLHWCRYERPTFVPDEWFGPQRLRPALAGSWTGRFENDLGESGKETLTLSQKDNGALQGVWSGVIVNGERIGNERFFFEAQTSNRLYRGAGQVSSDRMQIDYVAHRTDGNAGVYHGWSELQRQGEVAETTHDPHMPFAGRWDGHYENSRSDTGPENLELSENAGQLKGVWSTIPITGERLGNSRFYLTGASGSRKYRVVGHATRGELRLDYSATDGNERYFGWSTLKQSDR